MKLAIHIYHHFDQEQLGRLQKQLQSITINQGIFMSALENIKQAIEAQKFAITAQTHAIDSIVAGLDGLKSQLDQAIVAGSDSATLQTLADQITQQTAMITGQTSAINNALAHDVIGVAVTSTPSTDTFTAPGETGAQQADVDAVAASANPAADQDQAAA